MKTGKGFLEHIAKYICSVLVFIVIITMTSCSDSSEKKTAGVAATAVPTVLPAPPSNTLDFSVEKDRIDFVAIVINSHSGNGYKGNRARIHDKRGMDATIQMLNSIEVCPKEESYKYYGGDSPEVMINFFDEKDDVVERLNIYLDLKLNEYVLRFRENNYKINSSEIDKIHEFCELYDDTYRKDRPDYDEADSGKKRRKGRS